MLNTLTRRSFLASAAAAATLAAKPGPWLVGANTAIQGYSLDRAIALLAELQFPVIEIHPMGRPEPTPKVFPGFTFDQLDPAAKQKIKAALKPFRKITTHLPYTGLDWMSDDAAKRQSSIRAVDVALEGSAHFGAVMAVLHPQTIRGVEWKSRKQQYIDTIGRWATRAQQLGIRIAMETGFAPTTASYVEFVQTIGHPNVGVTVDVGHQSRYAELTAKVGSAPKSNPESIRAYNDTTISIINRLGAKIFHLHVHDIDPETWQEHKPMQHGFVDYPRIFDSLTKANYKGVLILEIGGDPGKMPGYLREARDKFRAWLA